MSDTHAVDIKKHVRTYMIVFASLMVLTMVTVAVYYLHLSIVAAIAVALFVASIKAGLVATYFMHLISERKLILYLLAFTVFFFIALMLLPSLEVFTR
jgi:cytochrome c oxidase subunit IV